MLDFTSSLYLGLRHPSAEFVGWRSLTTGRPAALGEFADAKVLGGRLAALIGTGSAIAVTSTLHGLLDVLETLAVHSCVIGTDRASYALGQVAVERLAGRGVPARPLPHFDPTAAAALGAAYPDRRLIVVVDGLCPCCGRFAPLAELAEIAVRQHDGVVVVDDAQAIGLAGHDPSTSDPYGVGGGGTLQRLGLDRADGVVVVASLAKAFGAPIAALAGSEAVVGEVARAGTTRLHASPPALTSLRAAMASLDANARDGDRLRRRLARRVQLFRDVLRESRILPLDGGPFPVQSVPVADDDTARHAVEHLRARGVAAVPVRRRCRDGAAIAFLIRSDHQESDVRSGARAVAGALDEIATERAPARRWAT